MGRNSYDHLSNLEVNPEKMNAVREWPQININSRSSLGLLVTRDDLWRDFVKIVEILRCLS